MGLLVHEMNPKHSLVAALALMAMIVIAMFVAASLHGSEKAELIYLFGGAFSGGCVAIFGLLRRGR